MTENDFLLLITVRFCLLQFSAVSFHHLPLQVCLFCSTVICCSFICYNVWLYFFSCISISALFLFASRNNVFPPFLDPIFSFSSARFTFFYCRVYRCLGCRALTYGLQTSGSELNTNTVMSLFCAGFTLPAGEDLPRKTSRQVDDPYGWPSVFIIQNREQIHTPTCKADSVLAAVFNSRRGDHHALPLNSDKDYDTLEIELINMPTLKFAPKVILKMI